MELHTMKSLSNSSVPFPYSHGDILMKMILQTHAPDGSRIDSVPLLRLAEEIIRNITTPSGAKSTANLFQPSKSPMEAIWADTHNELGRTVHHISCEIVRYSSKERSSHATTMAVLELLGNHSWGTKVIIVLTALAKNYGEFWLTLQLCDTNSLALSIVRLKGLKNSLGNMESFGYRFKALRYLFEKMVDVAKCIVEFEILPVQYVTLDYEAMASVKTQIHITSYWVIRSSVACASQITSNTAMKSEQMYTSSISATWELWSSAHKISDMHHRLRKQLDDFFVQIEKKIHSRLLYLFEEVHVDNQKVLSTLFALKDDFPLRDYSQKKVGVEELRNKEVILFISRPVIKPEKFFLIMQQLQNNPHNKPEKLYEIVWIPIANSIPWSQVEETTFNYVVDTSPWYSLYEPSTLSLSVVKFIQEAWHFQDEPLMVVLDSKGRVTSLNAIDMVSIWGAMAYPFSMSRERELWEEQSWTIEFLLNGIDPLISYWMEDGRTICLYGSKNLEWVQELTIKMKDIAGILLIYIGSSYVEHSKDILATIMKERLSSYLCYTKICIFWLRLESVRSSKLRLGYKIESDVIMREVTSLFSLDSGNKGWLLVSEGSTKEILILSGNEVLECLSQFRVWGEKVNRLGFLGSIRKALDPSSVIEHCGYSSVTPYVEGMDERTIVCKNCKCPMEKHFMYQCVTN